MTLGHVRYVQHLKEGSKPTEVQLYLANFKELYYSVMDTIDLKLSECYWLQISNIISESGGESFPQFFTKLDNIWELLIKQFEMFLPSQVFQKAIVFVILECAFKPQPSAAMRKGVLLQQHIGEKLIEVVMDVFLRCHHEDKEAHSYCLWAFVFYAKRYKSQNSHEKLIHLIMENEPNAGRKLLLLFIPENPYGAIINPFIQLIQSLDCYLDKKD